MKCIAMFYTVQCIAMLYNVQCIAMYLPWWEQDLHLIVGISFSLVRSAHATLTWSASLLSQIITEEEEVEEEEEEGEGEWEEEEWEEEDREEEDGEEEEEKDKIEGEINKRK